MGGAGSGEHTSGGHMPQPHGLLALQRGETGRGPEQGPLNCWSFEQGTLLPRPIGEIK